MATTQLSVNINKFATLRNARGGNNPNLVQVAKDCQRFGAQGITVHPRPDERHIKYSDIYALKEVVYTEFNIEGNPQEGRFMEVVLDVKPAQATLVPDGENAITSNAGWDTVKHKNYLKETIAQLQEAGIRTSIFVDPIPVMIEGAVATGTDRIELYTENYARNFHSDSIKAISAYAESARLANSLGLGLNAGHDLDLDNLKYFQQNIPELQEVSIGHALICDSIYLGLENTIQLYLKALSK